MGVNLERRSEIGADRRKKTFVKILKNVLQLLSTAPFESFTTDDFVLASEVSRGTFYNYFKTKDELADVISMLLESIAAINFRDASSRPTVFIDDDVPVFFYTFLDLAIRAPDTVLLMCREFLSNYPSFPTFAEEAYILALQSMKNLPAHGSGTEIEFETMATVSAGGLAMLIIRFIEAPEANKTAIMRSGVKHLLMSIGIESSRAVGLAQEVESTLPLADLDDLDEAFDAVACRFLGF